MLEKYPQESFLNSYFNMDSMPTTRFIFLLLLGNLFIAYRPLQAQHLYLLMAHSEDLINAGHPDYKTTFPKNDSAKLAILFKYASDSLEVVDTVNFDWKRNSKIKELRHFDDYRFFFMEEEGNFDAAEYRAGGNEFFERSVFISILDYSSDTLIIRKAYQDSLLDGFDPLKGMSYIQNSNLVYTFSFARERRNNYARNTIDKNLFVSSLKVENFMDSTYCKSESGYFIRETSGAPYNKLGKLVKGFDRTKVNEWQEVLIHPPYNEKDGKYFRALTYIVKTPDFNYFLGIKKSLVEVSIPSPPTTPITKPNPRGTA